MFQVAHEFDEQDRQLGMDTYCICTEMGGVTYGGVERLLADDEGVVLVLERAAAEKLGVPESFRIQLAIDPSERATVIDGLRRILAVGRSSP